MGKFDGYLICSDVDGTLAYAGNVPERNLDAIRYFQSEGGRFTLATGRQLGYEARFPVTLNAPLISENGTRISDPDSGRVLWSFPLDGCGLLLEHLDRDPAPATSLWFEDGGLVVSGFGVADAVSAHTTGDLLKIVLHNFAAEGDAIARTTSLRESFAERYFVCRSWPTGVEVISPLAGKGACLSYVKQICEDVHTTVGIGDFENDLSLLAAADLSFAPAGACPEILRAAGEILCPHEEGAIAHLIERLEVLSKR